MGLREHMNDMARACAHVGRHMAHKAETPVHLAYFGLVFIESHGLYGYAALGLLCIHLVHVAEGMKGGQ